MALRNPKVNAPHRTSLSQQDIARQIADSSEFDVYAAAARDVEDIFARLEHILSSPKLPGTPHP